MARRALSLAFGTMVLVAWLVALGGATAEMSISDAQQALIERGFDPGGIDGKIGPRTRKAIRAFQAAQGLPQTGELDPPTLERLFPPALPTPTPEPVAKPPPVDPATTSTPSTSIPFAPAPPALERPQSTGDAAPPRPTDSWTSQLIILVILSVMIWWLRRWRGRRRANTRSSHASEASLTQLSGPTRADATGRRTSAVDGSDNASIDWWSVGMHTTANRKTSAKEAKWFKRGEAVSVAGFSLTDGLIYVGHSLPLVQGATPNDNCLIDPFLPVAECDPDWAGETMSYWPAYSTISPQARLAYLSWLAGGRTDPSVGIGHVFLFFYGLERRLSVDHAMDEAAEIIREVERLLSVYGANRSFDRYARQFLDNWSRDSRA
jgi:peptidoglycan hydrolase-like protein with peptidoglycan-binding domain